MKHVSAFIFCIIISTFVSAQQKKIDSLLKLLKNDKQDTIKVNHLNALSDRYTYVSKYDSAIYYAKEAIALANILINNWQKNPNNHLVIQTLKGDFATSYNHIAIVHDYRSNYDTAYDFYMKALSIYKNIGDRDGESICIGNIGILFSEQGKFMTALDYYFKAQKICEEINNGKRLGYILGNIGNTYSNLGDYSKAAEYLKKALSISEETGDDNLTGTWLVGLGELYNFQSNPSSSLDYYFKAIKIMEKLGNRAACASINGAIGVIYEAQDDTNTALTYLQNAMNIDDSIGDKNGTSIWLHNIGNIRKSQSQLTEAITCFQKSLKIADEIGNKSMVSSNFMAIGDIYQHQLDHKMALDYYYKSLKIVDTAKNKYDISLLNERIGTTFINLKKYGEAENHLSKALKIARELGALDVVQEAYLNLSQLYEIEKKYPSAYKYYKLHIQTRDSIFNQENKKQLVRKKMNYEFEKKEAITQAKHDKEIAVKNEENKRQLQLGILIGLVVVTTVPFGFYTYKRRRDGQRKILEAQQETLVAQFQQQVLEARQEAVNAQLDAHFVGDTMDSIDRFIRENDKDSASEYLIKFNRLIRRVLDNSSKKAISLKEELIVVDDYFQLAKLRFTGPITLNIIIPKEIDQDTTLFPPMIFHVLVDNSVQHGFDKNEGGIIILKVENNNDILHCSVEDNGMGREAARKNQNIERASVGNALAEKLLNIWNKQEGLTSYKIIDLYDENGLASGTRVEFSFPFISNE